jgi:hypothetical protein
LQVEHSQDGGADSDEGVMDVIHGSDFFMLEKRIGDLYNGVNKIR